MAADDYHIITKHGKTTTASAVSPNSIKKPKERVPATPDMPEVNRYLMCQLCSGYLIDATAIIECQHTFCKSCILKYLETNSYCPICDVQLNKADPQYSLRSDVIIQRLVYKLVPGLLVSESKRRRDFYIKNDMEPVAAAELAANSLAVEIEAASDMSTVLSLDDVVSLSIEYFRSDDKTSTTSPGSTKPTDANGKQQQSTTAPSSATQSCQNQQPKSNVKSFSVNNSSGGTSISDTNASAASSTDNNGSDNSNTSEQANDRRYLQCPAGVSVGLLKKFIRRKYGLSDDYRVDLLYNGNRDSILESDLTLLDVAFIYKWNKDDPMKFQYRIFERPPKSMTIYSGMKRPANSMMDEPPDDDTASGPHNGSSMFSSSSAPSSKLPRLGDNTTNTTTQGNQGNVPKDNTSGKSTATSADPTPTSATGTVSCKTSASSSTHTAIKVEKEEVDEDDDDEDDEEDYELVERKEHMKGIKSSRKNSIKESMKKSVAASNLRSHISRSSSSHSTDTKDSVDSERESGNENSLNSSNSGSKRNSNANPVKKRANSYEATGRPRGRPPKHVDSLRLRVTSSDNSRTEPQSTGSLKMSISTSGITPVVSSSPGEEKKDPIKLSLGTVLANKGSKSPDRKHHKRKHHHHHKLRHRDKQSKGLSSASSSPPTNQKPMKLIFTLSPPGTATVQQTQGNQSQNSKSTTLIKPSQDSEVKEQKGKPLAGTQQNYNNSARTSASAHGHLNNISKSISVSINTNVNSNSGASVSNNANKGGQQGNKILSPAELIPKNTGMEIQPTTIPISSSHGQNSQHSMQQQNSSNVPSNNSNNSHKHSHPLLPDSVHVPKSVTLIPVNNPNTMNLNSNNSVGGGGGGSSLEKGGSGSHHGNQNRINSHTFTHPITNKSLHQITVTEVPPPQKTSGGMGNSSLGNHNTGMGNNTGNTTLHSSISGTTSNPIEKVIANAANNKPQFNGPGSMEITKINCWTATSKENPAKKLKDRRGLDISITGTGINVNLNKSAQKLEETLRQKVNIATGGGNGSISVTPVAPPNSLGSGNYCNNVITTSSAGGSNMNKMKSVSATAASLLSGKMPPGITIGPATVPQNSSNNGSNPANNNINNNSGGSGSASVGNNIMKGLGFTLPPHLTAHPHNPNNMKNMSNQGKPDKIQTNTIHTNNSRLLGKDSVSIIGKGGAGIAGGLQHQPPPPVEITISATGGNKSQTNITNRGINIVNNSKINNDPLASIFDITQGLRKSPTPAINNNAKDNNSKQQNSIQTPNATQSGNVGGSSSSMNTKNMANKRPYDMPPSGNAVQTGNKKVTKESSEMKRARSASTSSEPSSSTKQPGKPEGEIPLDLSGRSTRTTPPITIPHREPSKSPTATTTSAVPNEKRAPAKSSETEKSGKVISPSSSTSSGSTASKNFLSPKMNTQKNSAVEPFNKGQQPNKSISVSKLSPNQASKIGSIVDSLAQKQAQAQAQQHLQHVKNSQIQQQQHRSQSSHHHSSNVTSNPNNSTHSNSNANNSGMPNLKTSQSNSNSNSNNAGKTSSSSSIGITSPIPASSSMTSPVMPMTSPSPPGTDHMRNLWTLSDTAVRQGKLNSMNELLAAASLFSPPGHPHSLAGAAAAHQLAAAAAAASPSGAFNSNIMAQFGHHLAALGANKIPPGMFDHHFMAAAMNAHNAHAAASGMRMAHPFAGSMSPPLNAFYSHGSPAGQQQSPIPGAALGQKVQNPPSANKSGICGTGKSNSIPFAPLFSHSVPVSSPKSPNSGNLSASGGPPSVKTPTTCNSIPPPVLPFSSPVTNSGMSNHSGSPATNKDQKPTHSASGKGSGSLPSSGGGGVGGKSTKINGTMSTAMPVFPPGIHNPLLQPRSSTNSNSNNSSNSSGNCFQSGSSTGASSKTFSTVAALSNKTASKGGIPNSMKISNFLPSKPKDPASNANTEATITSGSNFGIPPLQSKPNFSLSHSRSPSESLSLNNSMNIAKSPSFKEGPLSPVKSVASGGTAGASISPTNKPSSLTCASLLLPDSMYSKPSTHHLLNSLSPTKGDHGNLGLCRSNRTPSSDSVLLSPNSSPSHKANRTTSPGASSYAFPKPGSRSEDISSKPPHRTISPTKDESSSKKEKGGIPMGASLARNFTPSTTSSISQLTHNAPCLSLTRPIPTIPAFFNRSCSNTSTSMSSNTNSNISHHHHQHKTPSSGRMPTSPAKMSNDQQQHLPSPIFPFPGVSVPVQVKLQDDNEVASVTVAPNTPITTTTSITTLPTHSISLKSEVNKVMTAKEEKIKENRKRSISPPSTPGDSKLGAGDSKPTQLASELVAPCKTTLVRENSIEISPAKVQKVEIQATAPSTVKNELEKQERLIISESKCNSRNSESVNNAGSSTKAESMERKENESQSSQRESGKGGEQGEERKSEREGADPSTEFSSASNTLHAKSQGPCKVEAEISSAVKAVETLGVEVALSQMQTELTKPEKEESLVISVEEEKSETQIVVDTECPKSDEIKSEVNHQKSKTFEIPEEKEDGKIIGTVATEAEKTEDNAEDDIDIEMVNEKDEETSLLKQSKIHAEVEMDVVEDNQMEIDVDTNEEKMDDAEGKVVTEERLILTKEDDDLDVDILDVGVDEPMEVTTDGIINSTENQLMEEEATERVDEAEKMCIHNEESIPSIPAISNHDHDNESNLEIIELPENPSAGLDNDDVEENEMNESKITEEDGEPGEDLTKQEEIEKEAVEEPESEPTNDCEEDSTFLPENESTTFSQDDSECGDLIIDLGPNDEEDTEEQKDNKLEETDDLDQVASVVAEPSQEENICSQETEVILKEVSANEESCSLETLTKNEIALNEPSSTFPINSEDETVEEQPEEKSELSEGKEESIPSDENSSMESAKVVLANVEPLNQDSILNQITINPAPIEVNGVIKADMESEEHEEREKIPLSPPSVVSECPQPALYSANEQGEEEKNEETSNSEQAMVKEPECELSGNAEVDSQEENEITYSIDSSVKATETAEVSTDSAQLDQVGSPSIEDVVFPLDDDNKNIADMEEEMLVEDKCKIEEENSTIPDDSEELGTISLEILTSNENVCEVVPIQENITPIQFPEKDNNITDIEINISVSNDIMEQETGSSVVVTGEEDVEGTPMETEEADGQEEVASSSDVQMISPEAPSSVDSPTIVPIVDDVSMQIETDSALPTDDSSTCVPTESNIADESVSPANELPQQDSPTDTQAEQVEKSNDAGSAHIEEGSTPSPVPTPTTSTSSVAIKLDISASNEGEGELNGGGNSAESLSPPSKITTTSSSLIIPANTSGSSSSGLKSLESFGKVAAGLLASATSTINNNNNNTSLAPTSCDAISIVTTNANA